MRRCRPASLRVPAIRSLVTVYTSSISWALRQTICLTARHLILARYYALQVRMALFTGLAIGRR
jgi:hypothetical protein